MEPKKIYSCEKSRCFARDRGVLHSTMCVVPEIVVLCLVLRCARDRGVVLSIMWTPQGRGVEHERERERERESSGPQRVVVIFGVGQPAAETVKCCSRNVITQHV